MTLDGPEFVVGRCSSKRVPRVGPRVGLFKSRAVSGLSAVLLLALTVGGCTKLGPDFGTPPAPPAEDWLESGDPKIKAETRDYSTWWTVLDDPVLDELIGLAYKQNLPLQIAGIRILEARARLGIAVGSQYPQVQDATASYTHTGQSENAANSASLNRVYQDAQVGFDASWELDFWGRFQRGIESADASLGATIADYDDILVSLTAEVATSYVRIRELEERLVLTRENANLQQRTLEITEVRFRGGLVSELDVQQAKGLLRDTQSSIPDIERLIRQARNALAVLLGMPPQKLQAVLGGPGTIPDPPAELAVGIPAELLRRRPDIRGAELAAAAQSARIGIAESDLYPRFTLAGFIGLQTSNNGGIQSNNADLGDLFDSDSFTAFLGPSLRLPLFNYGRLTNNVRVEDARFQQLAVNYENTVLRAYQEVEDGLIGFLRGQDQAALLAESVTAAERSVELALLQYREGLVDFIRVVDAQRFQTLQEDRHAASRGSIVRSLIATYRALGGGWTVRGANEFVPEDIQEEMRARTNWGDVIPPSDLQEAPMTAADIYVKDAVFRRPDW
jgi:NodT family efflux transporter outer membrane factor (OMF) lipoprotein